MVARKNYLLLVQNQTFTTQFTWVAFMPQNPQKFVPHEYFYPYVHIYMYIYVHIYIYIYIYIHTISHA